MKKIFSFLCIPLLLSASYITIEGDFLYWKAAEQGLEYAMAPAYRYPPPPPNTLIWRDDMKIKNIRPDWNPGFRVALERQYLFERTNVRAEWVHYDASKTNTTAVSLPSVFIVSTQNFGGDGGFGTSQDLPNFAKASWWLHCNFFDLKFTREFSLSEHFNIIPYIGAEGDTIKQKIDISYRFFPIDPLGDTSFANNSIHFWGVGPLMGFVTDWKFVRGFGLYSNLGFSSLYGQYHDQYRTGGANFTTDLIAPNNYHNTQYVTPFHFQIALGLKGSWSFGCDQYKFGLAFGWEEHIWFGMNKAIDEVALPLFISVIDKNDDLVLRGIVASGQFDF